MILRVKEGFSGCPRRPFLLGKNGKINAGSCGKSPFSYFPAVLPTSARFSGLFYFIHIRTTFLNAYFSPCTRDIHRGSAIPFAVSTSRAVRSHSVLELCYAELAGSPSLAFLHPSRARRSILRIPHTLNSSKYFFGSAFAYFKISFRSRAESIMSVGVTPFQVQYPSSKR